MANKKISDAVYRMIEVMRMHKAKASEKVESLYPNRSAHMVLMYLSCTEECSSQRELSESFHLTPAAMTGILKKLEDDGYIERRQGLDARNKLIRITERGLEIVEQSKEVFSLLDEQLLAGFSEDETEALISYFTRMKSNIEKIEGEKSRL